MVDANELLEILATGLPSQRAAAAELIRRDPTTLTRDQLLSAVTRESIGAIRRSLQDALERYPTSTHDAGRTRESEMRAVDVDSTSDRLRDLAGLITHETEPAIGWLRRAAARELGDDFEESDTNRLIETLRERIAGLVLLTNASRPLTVNSLDLSAAIKEALSELSDQRVSVRIVRSGVSADVDTDNRLLGLILSNAFRNAIEASQALESGNNEVVVEVGTNQSEFWITIRNRFDGSSFSLDEVANTGMSSKADHKGYGVSAMRYAAERLGYVLSLTGTGGVALFSLRGPRHRG